MRALLFLLLITSASAQTVDKAFWTVTAASASMTALDAYTTVRYIGRGVCPEEVGSPVLYGSSPSAHRVSLVMGGLFAASVGVSYLLKRKQVRIFKLPTWPAPEAYLALGHALGGIHNLRDCR